MCGMPRSAMDFAVAITQDEPAVEAPAGDEPSPAEPASGTASPPEPATAAQLKPLLPAVEPPPQPVSQSPVTTVVRMERSPWPFWITAGLVGLGLLVGWIALRDRGPQVMAAFLPTPSPLPPTVTYTPTWTPIPSETPPPADTATPTPVPPPTSTPRPPRSHTVESGETLFGLSLIYRISAESIAEANGFGMDAPIQTGQALTIPWPSPTPQLESMIITINGEPVVADVTDCEIVTIQDGDSAYALSVNRSVPLEAIIQVNRQTADSIGLLQPGDTLCIPRIVYADTLPPTPGPSPTPLPTSLPGGTNLLYPVEGTQLVDGTPLLLQWTAVKDLAADEWYMVEMRDLDEDDAFPRRGFTRDTSFRVPASWRPQVAEERPMRWQVSIVQVNGRRSDGAFTYTYGGESSPPSHFTWLGAVSTPQPTLTPTATSTVGP
jgi:LysM repeat protein